MCSPGSLSGPPSTNRYVRHFALSEKPFYERRSKAILEPFQFITSNPGKEIRGKLIEAFNIWLDVPAGKLKVIAKVVNMLHAASLM